LLLLLLGTPAVADEEDIILGITLIALSARPIEVAVVW